MKRNKKKERAGVFTTAARLPETNSINTFVKRSVTPLTNY